MKRFKVFRGVRINLQLFANDNTMDFEGAENTESTEELNMAQEDDFFDGLGGDDFVDDEPEDNENEEDNESGEDEEESDQEESEESTDEGENEEDENQEEADKQLFKVKHLGQEIELTMEQMIENAQKGLDYDRIRQDRDNLKNSREIQIIDELAKEAGLDRATFLENFYESLEQSKINERAGVIASERNIEPEIALEIAKYERENEKLKQKMEAENNAKKEAQDKSNQVLSDFNALFTAHPEIKEQYSSFDKLPEAFKSRLSQGEQPLVAWNNYLLEVKEAELKQKEKEIEAIKNNKVNKKRSSGSAKGAGQSRETDDFLKGLFG